MNIDVLLTVENKEPQILVLATKTYFSDRPSYELLSYWTQILRLGFRTFTPAAE